MYGYDRARFDDATKLNNKIVGQVRFFSVVKVRIFCEVGGSFRTNQLSLLNLLLYKLSLLNLLL